MIKPAPQADYDFIAEASAREGRNNSLDQVTHKLSTPNVVQYQTFVVHRVWSSPRQWRALEFVDETKQSLASFGRKAIKDKDPGRRLLHQSSHLGRVAVSERWNEKCLNLGRVRCLKKLWRGDCVFCSKCVDESELAMTKLLVLIEGFAVAVKRPLK